MPGPSNSVFRRTVRLFGATFVVAIAVMVVMPGAPVHAHTGFSGSTPSDGDVVDAPVSLVTLVFTGESEQAGDGFVVLDASGQVREPTLVTTLDAKVFTLTFDPPLAGGEIGVRWSVRAPDAHPIEGAFSFTVAASPAVAATPATSTSTTDVVPVAQGGSDMSQMSASEMASMDDFLAVETARPGESQATLGRLLSFAGIALALGGVAFTATTLRGESAEIVWLLRGVQIAGGAVLVGAVVEYGGVVRVAGDSLAGYWTSSSGFATVLRMLAGLAIALGFAATTVALRPPRRPKPLSAAPNSPHQVDHPSGFWNAEVSPTQPSAVPLRTSESDREPAQRWIPDRSSALGFVGCGAALMSFWFDGHTLSKGFRALHAVANSVHVFAGSVWTGGVVAMAAIMWSRHRRGVPTRSLQLVVRFSSVATAALGAVVVAGLVMAVIVLDSFGDLTGTEWGQVLLLKSAAVGLALVGGAYNHFRLLPALEAHPSDRMLHEQVRSVVTAEAIMLSFVVVTTAWFVAAAS